MKLLYFFRIKIHYKRRGERRGANFTFYISFVFSAVPEYRTPSTRLITRPGLGTSQTFCARCRRKYSNTHLRVTSRTHPLSYRFLWVLETKFFSAGEYVRHFLTRWYCKIFIEPSCSLYSIVNTVSQLRAFPLEIKSPLGMGWTIYTAVIQNIQFQQQLFI